jgi:osmotically inducible protein OsmC
LFESFDRLGAPSHSAGTSAILSGFTPIQQWEYTMKSTARANWQGDLFGGSGTASLNSGAAGPLPVSWASRTEEAAGKTSPEDDTKAVATFEKTDDGFRLTTMALSVVGTVPGLDAAGFAEHAAAAKDGCPVSNALVGNVDITLEATLA